VVIIVEIDASSPAIDTWFLFVSFLKYLCTTRVIATNELVAGEAVPVNAERTFNLLVGKAVALKLTSRKREISPPFICL
jgi:hypothetical protein